ncbi:MAG: NAD(P)/FAD-dependent oxidoreductase [Roseiflexus sp.]|nr:NAD(P)/FAD-dependent oxidoreductase [Roseiflexus sp.]MCS7287624.1 NAD(P)/FAD-dependent oxidoreductase [Roseiflexus sp.]MDW8234376.1 NAD(P)/FAD-dependent oxidoreductase [Roseiflexaceae bacterium]
MRELIIIGGGAAGLAAGMYALGKQLDFVLIYESLGGKAGWRQNLIGQEEVEYLAGEEAVRIFERKIAMQTDRTIRDTVTAVHRSDQGFRVETRNHGVLESLAVIVATGATPVRLKATGAQELLGQGLGYSVTTHAHLLAGKTAAVIGATHRALRGVAELARTAAKVYLIIPEPHDVSLPMMHAVSQRPNVEILAGYAVDEIVGPMNVEEIVISRAKEQRRIAVDAAFVDLGLRPCSEMVQHLVRTDQDGFIWVDERMATTVPGIFAAGDVTTSFGEQVLIAIGDGARAALSAYDYLLMRGPIAR